MGAVSAPGRPRELTGEKAQRIIEAMRESVAEVGIAGSTFERVAAKAGVSRGLLHYYFATKENLLVEVIRRDTDIRIEVLGGAMREARTVDEVIAALFTMFERTMTEQQGYVYMVTELFIAGRHNPEIRRELGELYSRARAHFAEILRDKEREGALRLRLDAESIVSYLFAAGDGGAIQRISDPDYDATAGAAAAYQVTRFLLDAEATG
jgi:AcrR family transcriptional regulator